MNTSSNPVRPMMSPSLALADLDLLQALVAEECSHIAPLLAAVLVHTDDALAHLDAAADDAPVAIRPR